MSQKDDLKALMKALEAGPLPKGFYSEPLTYRHTSRGNPHTVLNKKTQEIMTGVWIAWDKRGSYFEGQVVGKKYKNKYGFDSWRQKDCEVIAQVWDNKPEFLDDRRSGLDKLHEFIDEEVKRWKQSKKV